jgi:glycosyltransferase involved in cell wall biosynthesis/sugar phosphate isomerase/epimerase
MPTRTGNFPIGFRRAGVEWQKNLPALAQWAKSAGFDIIDFTHRAGAEDFKTLKDNGLTVGSVDLLDFGQILANDAGKRKDVLEANLKHVKEAAASGARAFFTCIIPGDPTRKRGENYALAVQCYSPIAQACAEVGAALAVEGWPGGAPQLANLCCTPETVRQFIKDVGRGAGLNYDPSHLIRLGVDHIRFLKEFASHVKHVHAKDTDVSEDALYEFGRQPGTFAPSHRWGEWVWRYTIPGHGIARWGEIFSILKDSSYKGAVSVELEDENFNGSEEGEKRALNASIAYLKSICWSSLIRVPRRILLFVTDLEIGGTPTVVRELATRLQGRSVDIEVACLKPAGAVAAEIIDVGVMVTSLGVTSAAQLPWAVKRLRALVRERAVDTVLSFLVHANTVAALAARALDGVRFIQSIQTTQPRPRWHWWVQSLVQQSAQAVVVPSPSAAEVAATRGGVPRDKLVVISNAVDPRAFEPSAIPSKNPSPYPIGFIGRLDPVKRIPDLIEAARLMGNRVTLQIFGEGRERERLVAPAALRGAIARPQEALSQIGLLVLPSEAEGFGLVLIEAMAACVPVIGTNVPGIRDVIEDGVNGLLVPLGDVRALAAAMERVVWNRQLRDRLIEGGLRSVRARFTWGVVLPMYQRLLRID